MNQKERLVEVLKNAHDEQKYLTSDKSINAIADYLLEQGVIVPPCKVGQTLYSIQGFDGKPEQCEPYTVTDITIYENTITIHIQDEWLFVRNMYPDDIGKTVFTSREDAEKALRKEQNNE